MKVPPLDAIDRLILLGLVSGTLGFLFTWWPAAFLFVSAVSFVLAVVWDRRTEVKP